MRKLTMLFLAGLATGCGRESTTSLRAAAAAPTPNLLNDPDHVRYPEGDAFQFIAIGGNYVGVLAHVKDDAIRVCLQGVSAAALPAWQQKISTAILPWVDAIRDMSTVPLASKVIFVADTCHVTVLVQGQQTAYTEIKAEPRMVVGPSGYYASYPVMLHEFGHTFGLSDTYYNGRSGNCIPGQPQAIMCNTSFTTLQPDDIAGIRSVFKKLAP